MATPEERRAKDAERKRLARAKARAEAVAKKAAAADVPDVSAPRVMQDTVESSLSAMSKWLVESDGASVAQVRMLAKQVDDLTHAGEVTKALSAHRALSMVLDRIGGTPVVRLQHELRSRKLAGAITEVPSGEGDEAGKPKAGNVTQFERPPKRKAR